MPNNSPLISVIITTFNVEKYIKEAIDSVLQQTIQDFELVIVDDGSSDHTINVIESILDTRIRLIKNSVNKGRVKSLNLAFQEAKGKYITIVDGDDVNVLNRFEKQLSVLENNSEIKVCGSWYEEFGFSNKIIKHSETHDVIQAKMLLGCSMTFGGSMFERKLVENFRFDENKLHVEDYDFWVRIVWSGQFYNIQEVLYHYRIHKSQVSTLYNDVQKHNDIEIKLFLYKKTGYDTTSFSDDFIKKMLYLKDYFTVEEFSLFLKWLKEIYKLNKRNKVYASHELEKVLNSIRKGLIYKIYFHSNFCGIDKKWRFQALKKMSLSELFFMLKLKIKEKFKILIQKKWN